MDLGLKNKKVLVTGSTKGIGKAVAHAFLSEGAIVAITGRGQDALNAVRLEFERAFGAGSVLALQADMTNEADISGCLKAIEDKWGGLDVLVANVGSGRGKPALEPGMGDWREMLEVNLLGSALVVKYTAPLMAKKGGGAIVFVSSIAGVEALPAPFPYSSAKAGLIALSKNLSRALAGDNIRVNAVAPGNVLAPGGVWERKLREDSDAVNKYINSEVPMRRLGKAEEIADAVLFLSSERSSFITGACLVVDGGQTRGFF